MDFIFYMIVKNYFILCKLQLIEKKTNANNKRYDGWQSCYLRIITKPVLHLLKSRFGTVEYKFYQIYKTITYLQNLKKIRKLKKKIEEKKRKQPFCLWGRKKSDERKVIKERLSTLFTEE